MVECESLQNSYLRGFESHPRLLLQNRLTGRSAPFEGVRLGSNPSSGIAPTRGNNLSNTGVRLPTSPFLGMNWYSTGQRVPRINLNNIVSFRRTAVAV